MTVERTTKYATTVASLPDAWAFVMDHIDELGEEPSIHIGPVWVFDHADGASTTRFEVAVEGMQEIV